MRLFLETLRNRIMLSGVPVVDPTSGQPVPVVTGTPADPNDSTPAPPTTPVVGGAGSGTTLTSIPGAGSTLSATPSPAS